MTAGPSARDAARRRLLEAALVHVPFEGWTRTAIDMGARDAAMAPGEGLRLFPGGTRELVSFFVAEADRAMLEDLAAIDLESLRVRERVATTVRVRLQRAAAHREAVLRALPYQAGPGGVKALYRTVDAIWRAAGDTATDFNFYTKRFLLAGVYTSTLLFWLDDASEDHEATWAFLDRRIADALAIGALKGRVRFPGPLRWLRASRRDA